MFTHWNFELCGLCINVAKTVSLFSLSPNVAKNSQRLFYYNVMWYLRCTACTLLCIGYTSCCFDVPGAENLIKLFLAKNKPWWLYTRKCSNWSCQTLMYCFILGLSAKHLRMIMSVNAPNVSQNITGHGVPATPKCFMNTKAKHFQLFTLKPHPYNAYLQLPISASAFFLAFLAAWHDNVRESFFDSTTPAFSHGRTGFICLFQRILHFFIRPLDDKQCN